jgi:hypothetical protein
MEEAEMTTEEEERVKAHLVAEKQKSSVKERLDRLYAELAARSTISRQSHGTADITALTADEIKKEIAICENRLKEIREIMGCKSH